MPRLQPFGEGLWLADGPAVSFLRIPYPTRMAVARLAGGALWVWSPIRLDEELRAEIDALGTVAWLVSPNKLHHLFLTDWMQAWPDAAAWASPGLREKRADLDFAGEFGSGAPPWSEEIDHVVVEGSFALSEVLFFHRASSTLLACDLVQRFELQGLSAWQRLVLRLDGLVGEHGSTPREWRLSFLRRAPARAARDRALLWNPERLVVAHGMCAEHEGRAVCERALSWMG